MGSGRLEEPHCWGDNVELQHVLRKLYWRAFRPVTLGSRCIVVSDGRVLLVEHTCQRWYYLPGGAVQRGESFADAARREVREETGLVVDDLTLLQIYYSQAEGKHDHIALFLAEDASGTITRQVSEIAEIGVYPLDALPAYTSPATRRRLSEYATDAFSSTW